MVNCSLKVGDQTLTPQEITEMFGRPFMGGWSAKGSWRPANPQKRAAAAQAFLQNSEPVILGADYTVPGETTWDNLRAAITAAHNYRLMFVLKNGRRT